MFFFFKFENEDIVLKFEIFHAYFSFLISKLAKFMHFCVTKKFYNLISETNLSFPIPILSEKMKNKMKKYEVCLVLYSLTIYLSSLYFLSIMDVFYFHVDRERKPSVLVNWSCGNSHSAFITPGCCWYSPWRWSIVYLALLSRLSVRFLHPSSSLCDYYSSSIRSNGVGDNFRFTVYVDETFRRSIQHLFRLRSVQD